jgi:integrase
VSLEEAREKATEARKVRRNGTDPIQAKREAEATARIEAARAITFGEAAKRFIKANRAGWKNAKHADQWLMTLLGIDQKGKPTKNDYCKTIRDLPIASIDTTLVLRIIEPIWASKTETASRIRSRIEQVIDAAKAKGEFKGENPGRWKGHLDNLLPATSKVRKVRNHPALPYRQLSNFMRKLRERDGAAAAALEFQILTAVRPGNAVVAKWDQIDQQTSVWTIPAALMKSDAEHRVPLSKAALAVLDRMEATKDDSEYIFPNSKGKPLSDASMAAVIESWSGAGSIRSSTAKSCRTASGHRSAIGLQSTAMTIPSPKLRSRTKSATKWSRPIGARPSSTCASGSWRTGLTIAPDLPAALTQSWRSGRSHEAGETGLAIPISR